MRLYFSISQSIRPSVDPSIPRFPTIRKKRLILTQSECGKRTQLYAAKIRACMRKHKRA